MQTVEKNFDASVLEKFRVDEAFNEPILHQVLRIAIYNELVAYETYTKVIQQFGAIQPFVNIIEAEKTHYAALLALLEKYQVALPLNDYSLTIQIPNTLQECCELGVASEIENIAMYDNLLGYTSNYADIQDVLFKLQAASYNNHLVAFRQAVQNSYSQNQPQNQPPILDKAHEQLNELNALSSKVASGNISQDEIMKLLSSTNLSFIGGALLGALGGAIMNEMTKKDHQEETKEEEK